MKLLTRLFGIMFSLSVLSLSLQASGTPEVEDPFNWNRTFVLKDNTLMTYTPEMIELGGIQIFGSFTSTVGSSINGLEITGQNLVISPRMSYEDFVGTLVASGIYEDKPQNWIESFILSNGLLLTHLPEWITVNQEYNFRNLKFTTGQGEFFFTPNMPYKNFVGTLVQSGLFTE